MIDAKDELIKVDQTVLESFVQNQGLQHLAEKIFLNLNYEALDACGSVTEAWKTFLDDPMFWLKRFVQRGLKGDYLRKIKWTGLKRFK